MVLVLAVPLAGHDLTKGACLLVLAKEESRPEGAVFFGGPSARGAAGMHGPRGEAGRCELFVSLLVMSRFVKKESHVGRYLRFCLLGEGR